MKWVKWSSILFFGITSSCTYYWHEPQVYYQCIDHCSKPIFIGNDGLVFSSWGKETNILYYIPLKQDSNPIKLTGLIKPEYYEAQYYVPKGNQVIIKKIIPNQKNKIGGESLWKISLSGGDTQPNLLFDRPGYRNPYLSPDGKLVVYCVHSTGSFYNICLMNLKTNIPKLIKTVVSFDDAAWSFDSKQIAICAMETTSNYGHLYLYNLQESTFKRVLTTDDDKDLIGVAWLPDGNNIVFARSLYYINKGGDQLIQYSIKNKKITRLTSPKQDAAYPNISPDGNKVVFIWRNNIQEKGKIAFINLK